MGCCLGVFVCRVDLRVLLFATGLGGFILLYGFLAVCWLFCFVLMVGCDWLCCGFVGCLYLGCLFCGVFLGGLAVVGCLNIDLVWFLVVAVGF